VFVADADAEAAKEVSHLGAEKQFQGEPEQEVILETFNAHRFQRINEQALAEIDTANYEHTLEILREREDTEEADCLLIRPSNRGCLSSTLSAMLRCSVARKRGPHRMRRSRQ
jgi:hypothetical protein